MNAPILPGRIEQSPIDRLRPYARNAETHDADQLAKIATSMAEFGWAVLEPVAANGERAGRCCFAMELAPTYCDVALRRWEMATGDLALRTVDQFQDVGCNGV